MSTEASYSICRVCVSFLTSTYHIFWLCFFYFGHKRKKSLSIVLMYLSFSTEQEVQLLLRSLIVFSGIAVGSMLTIAIPDIEF